MNVSHRQLSLSPPLEISVQDIASGRPTQLVLRLEISVSAPTLVSDQVLRIAAEQVLRDMAGRDGTARLTSLAWRERNQAHLSTALGPLLERENIQLHAVLSMEITDRARQKAGERAPRRFGGGALRARRKERTMRALSPPAQSLQTQRGRSSARLPPPAAATRWRVAMGSRESAPLSLPDAVLHMIAEGIPLEEARVRPRGELRWQDAVDIPAFRREHQRQTHGARAVRQMSAPRVYSYRDGLESFDGLSAAEVVACVQASLGDRHEVFCPEWDEWRRLDDVPELRTLVRG